MYEGRARDKERKNAVDALRQVREAVLARADLRTVIASVTDYHDSNLRWNADEAFDAIQAAAGAAGYSLFDFYLPDWRPAATEAETREVSTTLLPCATWLSFPLHISRIVSLSEKDTRQAGPQSVPQWAAPLLPQQPLRLEDPVTPSDALPRFTPTGGRRQSAGVDRTGAPDDADALTTGPAAVVGRRAAALVRLRAHIGGWPAPRPDAAWGSGFRSVITR